MSLGFFYVLSFLFFVFFEKIKNRKTNAHTSRCRYMTSGLVFDTNRSLYSNDMMLKSFFSLFYMILTHFLSFLSYHPIELLNIPIPAWIKMIVPWPRLAYWILVFELQIHITTLSILILVAHRFNFWIITKYLLYDFLSLQDLDLSLSKTLCHEIFH